MKKKITRQISKIIILAMILFVIINYLLQAFAAQRDMIAASEDLFWQLEQLIEENNQNYEVVINDFRDKCILRTRAAAYMVEHSDFSVDDIDGLDKILTMLEIDEIHIFDKNGNIISGTNPEYYGMNMADGEQISFFLPMLEDKSLMLCQDITENTSEGKEMQYAAVWMENGEYIIQCGLAPERLQEQTRKNEISYIFSLLTNEGGYTLYVVDPQSYQIIGSTTEEFTGKNLADIGISTKRLEKWDKGFHCRIGKEVSYCVFRQKDELIIGRSCNIDNLYSELNRNNIYLMCYIIIILLLVIYSIYRYIDKNVVHSIDLVNEKLGLIADGNLSERVEVRDTEEFAELSSHINYMVNRLLGSTEKISALLDVMELPIGVFEYNIHMPRVRITRRMALIIGVEGDAAEELFGDYQRFEQWIETLKTRPAEYADEVYTLPGVRDRYIQIYTFEKGSDRYGLVIDKTEEVRRCRDLELKLSEDELTKLCSRRSCYFQLDELFRQPKQLGHAVMMLVDSDDLKTVNDTYGHENGDHYLCGIAQVLKNTGAAKQVTARIGGDEFVVFIYGAKDVEELKGYLQRLLESRDTVTIALTNGELFPLRFSIGCAYYPGEKTDYHELMELADNCMYADKQRRKKNLR